MHGHFLPALPMPPLFGLNAVSLTQLPTHVGESPWTDRNGTLPTEKDFILRPVEAIVFTSFFATLGLTSFISNVLVCLVIYRSRRLQSTTNYFVVSLASADILLSVVLAPLLLVQARGLGRWPSGEACRLARLVQLLAVFAQTLVLFCICIDRFYTIIYPLIFKVSYDTCKKMILTSWLLATIMAGPSLYLFWAPGSFCSPFLPRRWVGLLYGTSVTLFGFALPLALGTLSFLRLARFLWELGITERMVSRTANSVPREKVKTVKMFLVVTASFAVSWLPFFCLLIWPPTIIGPQALSLSLGVSALALTCSLLKPALFWIYNYNFRRGVKETLCMRPLRFYRSNAYAITSSSCLARHHHVGLASYPDTGDARPRITHSRSFDFEKRLAWPASPTTSNTLV
uniref:probable G-protein coupled receptor 19 n=1 Tax=Myxine glutinosa TaxID=7769 RepID=UPI00358EF645